ncbi:MAG: rRNA maturation RNase YbeY [Gemmatimonadaceae bacterium]
MTNRTAARLPLSRARIAGLAEGVLRAERVREALVSVTLISPRAIAALNHRHLGHRGATDVLSFAFARAAGAPIIGDVYVAPDVARTNAKRIGIAAREELARLVVHGTLHVLGYDHPDGEERLASPMWRRQERLLARALGARR